MAQQQQPPAVVLTKVHTSCWAPGCTDAFMVEAYRAGSPLAECQAAHCGPLFSKVDDRIYLCHRHAKEPQKLAEWGLFSMTHRCKAFCKHFWENVNNRIALSTIIKEQCKACGATREWPREQGYDYPA
jgi:hypothetical protein